MRKTVGIATRDNLRHAFEKIRRELAYDTTLTVEDGVREVLHALNSGLIRNPLDEKYRNAQFIVQ